MQAKAYTGSPHFYQTNNCFTSNQNLHSSAYYTFDVEKCTCIPYYNRHCHKLQLNVGVFPIHIRKGRTLSKAKHGKALSAESIKVF